MVNMTKGRSHNSLFTIHYSLFTISEPAYKAAGRENSFRVPRLFHLAHDFEVVARRAPHVDLRLEVMWAAVDNKRPAEAAGCLAQSFGDGQDIGRACLGAQTNVYCCSLVIVSMISAGP